LKTRVEKTALKGEIGKGVIILLPIPRCYGENGYKLNNHSSGTFPLLPTGFGSYVSESAKTIFGI